MVSVTWLNELCSSQIKVGEKLNPAPHCNYLIGKVGNSQMKVNAVVAQNNFLISCSMDDLSLSCDYSGCKHSFLLK